MKKVLSFFELFFYIVGGVGGFGYTCRIHENFIAACVVVLAAMAWPQFKKCWKELNS